VALSKTSAAITQFTTSGTQASPTSVSAGIAPLVSLHHSNGSGTVTVAATAQIQYQVNGAVRWYAPLGLLVTFGTTTGATEDRTVILPDAATAVRIVYTVPTGATGPTLDAEIGFVTP
jgi:hypothetical protein